jgi:hypothetical protein
MRVRLAATLLLMFACVGASASDDIPRKNLALDNAETVLCGVDVSGDSIDWLTAKFGKPNHATDRPDTPSERGRRDYEWDLGTIRLRVRTVRGLGVTFFSDDTVETVEVWGPKALGEIGATGRGLQLGATIVDVGRIYGSQFGHEPKPSRIKTFAIAEPITITWDTAALEIYLDTNGKVNHIKLTKLDPWAYF